MIYRDRGATHGSRRARGKGLLGSGGLAACVLVLAGAGALAQDPRLAGGGQPAAPQTKAPGPVPGGDRDGDGILDALDPCPDAPENINGFRDQDGCPEGCALPGDVLRSARDRIGSESVIITFAPGKSSLEERAAQPIGGVANHLMSSLAADCVEIRGHVGEQDGKAAGQPLAARRAQYIRQLLEKGGVPSMLLRDVGLARGGGRDGQVTITLLATRYRLDPLEAKCRGCNGQWARCGIAGAACCVCSYADAFKPCRSGHECQGGCQLGSPADSELQGESWFEAEVRLDRADKRSGSCVPNDRTDGCRTLLTAEETPQGRRVRASPRRCVD